MVCHLFCITVVGITRFYRANLELEKIRGSMLPQGEHTLMEILL